MLTKYFLEEYLPELEGRPTDKYGRIKKSRAIKDYERRVDAGDFRGLLWSEGAINRGKR